MLIEKVKEFNKETKGVVKDCMKMAIDEDMVEYLDANTLELIQKYDRLLNLALEIAEEQAKILTELNMKVDKVLEVTNKD